MTLLAFTYGGQGDTFRNTAIQSIEKAADILYETSASVRRTCKLSEGADAATDLALSLFLVESAIQNPLKRQFEDHLYRNWPQLSRDLDLSIGGGQIRFSTLLRYGYADPAGIDLTNDCQAIAAIRAMAVRDRASGEDVRASFIRKYNGQVTRNAEGEIYTSLVQTLFIALHYRNPD